MRILILGGTGFTGPEQVDYALERGHHVTLFNRGRTRPGLFKGKVQEELIGDLNNDVSALKGKEFDVIIDNPTTLPLWVRNVAEVMKGRTKHYIFISTLSAYASNAQINGDVDVPTLPLPEGMDPYAVPPDQARRTYGPLKAHSEKEVAKHYPGMHTIIRPGLIVGPLDASDRFTWWPVRIAKGGDVLAPGNPGDFTQIIDSRDLAEWTIRMAENRVFGTYNAVGPKNPMTFAEMLGGIKAIGTSGAQFTWVPAEFLQANGIRAWSGANSMPVWINPTGRNIGFSRWSNERAVKAGLTYRPLAVTAKDVLDWHKTRTAEQQKALDEGMTCGVGPAKEAEIIAAWRAQQKSGS